MTILQNPIGAILDNYADAIEGGSAYRGSGTAYKGIAGTQGHDELAGKSITATGGDTTTVTQTDVLVDRPWVRTGTAPLFLLCTSATNSDNVGAARKVTAVAATHAVTVAAFPAAVSSGDVFTIREGFKRAPDSFDIEDEDAGSDEGFDRFFRLSAQAGRRLLWYGNNIYQYETEMELRLRLLKHNRGRKTIDSALENLMMIRSVITRPDHRDGTYAQLLDALDSEPEVSAEDKSKLVMIDRYRLVYRVTANFI